MAQPRVRLAAAGCGCVAARCRCGRCCGCCCCCCGVAAASAAAWLHAAAAVAAAAAAVAAVAAVAPAAVAAVAVAAAAAWLRLLRLRGCNLLSRLLLRLLPWPWLRVRGRRAAAVVAAGAAAAQSRGDAQAQQQEMGLATSTWKWSSQRPPLTARATTGNTAGKGHPTNGRHADFVTGGGPQAPRGGQDHGATQGYVRSPSTVGRKPGTEGVVYLHGHGKRHMRFGSHAAPSSGRASCCMAGARRRSATPLSLSPLGGRSTQRVAANTRARGARMALDLSALVPKGGGVR